MGNRAARGGEGAPTQQVGCAQPALVCTQVQQARKEGVARRGAEVGGEEPGRGCVALRHAPLAGAVSSVWRRRSARRRTVEPVRLPESSRMAERRRARSGGELISSPPSAASASACAASARCARHAAGTRHEGRAGGEGRDEVAGGGVGAALVVMVHYLAHPAAQRSLPARRQLVVVCGE